MPCKLPEDLSCVTDDVFSYMCSLAMEKCSKKSEKKKASCGGAAMRKRLLIKNFVAQMLAQERQNSGAYQNSNQKDEYDGLADERPTRMITCYRETITVNAATVDNCGEMVVDMDEEGGDEAEEEDEEEDADVEDDCEADPVFSAHASSSTTTFYDLNSHNHQQQQLHQQGSMISAFSLARTDNYQSNCDATASSATALDAEEEDEEDNDEDEEEDENDSDDENEEEEEDVEVVANSTSVDSAIREGAVNFMPLPTTAVASTSSEIFLHHHHHQSHYSSMEMLPMKSAEGVAELTDMCVESSMDENFMYISPCSSSLACSTSALLMCGEAVPSVYSTTNHFYDVSAGLLPCTLPHQAGMIYPPSSTSNASSMLPNSLGSVEAVNGSSGTSYVHGLDLNLQSPGSEWEGFHTVPPSRDYMMDDSGCHHDSDGFYSLFPPSSYPATPPESFSAQPHLQQRQQPQPQHLCHIIQDSIHLSPSSPPLPGSIFSTLKVTQRSKEKNGELIELKMSNTEEANDCSQPCKDSEDNVMSMQSSDMATTSYASIQALPDNFLDDGGVSMRDDVKLSGERISSTKIDKSDALALCFWNGEEDKNNDDQRNTFNEGDHSSSTSTKAAVNNELESNEIDENSGDNNKLAKSNLECLQPTKTSSQASPNAMYSVLPQVIKIGSCRSEFNQKSSYRRCITDLDTNTIVEEEYGNGGLMCYNSFSNNFHHTVTSKTTIVPSLRKRPSPPYFEAFAPEQSSRSGANSPTASGLCGMMMLTTSPKRVKL